MTNFIETDSELEDVVGKYRSIYDNAVHGIYQSTPAGHYLMVNEELARIYGYQSAEALVSRVNNISQQIYVEPGTRQRFLQLITVQDKITEFEAQIYRADGTTLWISESGRVVRDEQGHPSYYEGIVTDISARKNAEALLRESEKRYRTIFDHASVGFVTTTLQGQFLSVNPRFCEMMGYSPEELVAKTEFEITHVEDYENSAPEQQRLISGEVQYLFLEKRYIRQDGSHFWANIGISLVSDDQGDPVHTLAVIHDISDRKSAEVALKRQWESIEAATDGISILQDNIFIKINQAHVGLFGYDSSEEFLGKHWQILYYPDEVKRFEQTIMPLLHRDGAWQGEAIARRKDGSTFPEGLSLTLTEENVIICVCRDISELKQAQEQIIHNALHDPLTHLPNRTLLIERLELAMNRASRTEDYQYAVLFLDLDRFKVINDSLGHMVGDQLLISFVERLKLHLRDTDLIARLGGDEFVILLEDMNALEDIVHVVERILEDFYTPLMIHGHQIFISTSIGIVLGPGDYTQPTDLIRDADIAMYQAKAEEKNSYKFFDLAMHTQVLHRLTLETDLRKALENEEFTIHYQPIVNFNDLHLVGFEALVRWQHPTQGLIQPDIFIPIAEEIGLIVALDRWMLGHACQQLAAWQHQFDFASPLKISVNLSAQDLLPSLVTNIDCILTETGLFGSAINLEITERLLIEDIEKTTDLLSQLASRNIQISIDDFGTGYSSLNYLHCLPVNALKIDRSFVGEMEVDNRNYQVVNTIIALSNQLKLITVAEGIETQSQLQQLQQLGCQLGQGYLFSKPLTPQKITNLFRDGHFSSCFFDQKLGQELEVNA